MSTAESLKLLTRESHQALEGVIIRVIKKTRSMEEYFQLLKFFYGYYHPVEKLVYKYIDARHLADIEQRRKSSLLMNDMRSIQQVGLPIPVATDLPSINNISDAFAALYVLEGSTIGGKHILDMLRQHIAFPGRGTVSFFTGYGAATMESWNRFKSVLNNYFESRDDMEALAATANQTFRMFSHWAEISFNYARKEKL